MTADLRQSDGWAKYLQSLGWEVEEVEDAKIYIRKIPLLGSVIKIQRPTVVPPIKEIDRIARKHRALLVKLEPLAMTRSKIASPASRDNDSSLTGFVPDKTPNLPTKTILNDLTKSESDLWSALSRDARQSIKKAEGSNLKLVTSNWGKPNFEENLIKFHQLLSITSHRQGFWISNIDQLRAKCEAFGKDAVLFLVSQKTDSLSLAGALFLVSGETVFYHHAASSPLGQKLFAPYLLLWEALKSFKKRGILQLDHEGIVDPRFRQTKRWEKFTVFKRKWGGKEIEYPSPLVKYYSLPTKILFAVGGLLG